MSTLLNKKNIFFVLGIALFLSFGSIIYPQTKSNESLPEGYLSAPQNTSSGYIFTDEYNSALYLTNNGKTEKLIASPGCGRYVSINRQGTVIGYKFIDSLTGLQTPAIYNLQTRTATKLEDMTQNAGQVTFADNGTIAYTYENNLVILKNGIKTNYNLGTYSNRAPISPDGSAVIYRDDNDQLWLLTFSDGQKKMITDSKAGYANAVWSPDSKSIAFTTNGLGIYTIDIASNKTYYISEGEEPRWTSDSKQIVFYKKEIDFEKVRLLNSDIFIAGAKGEFVNALTNTKDVFEMEPVYDSFTNTVLYHTYSNREIRSINLSAQLKQTNNQVVFKLDAPLNINFYNRPVALLNKPADEPNWVHIHQVYDTREDWDQGRSCCGATSCMEAIATYGILPPSPMTVYSHQSNYGIYISNPYTFNNYTFTGYSYWYAGGHGYLWNASGSPYSNSVSYLQRHGITASRSDNVLFANLTYEFSYGYPYICCSTGLTSGHVVLAIGQYGTGHTLYFNDPYGDKNVGSYGYIRNGKNAIYDWSDANTGHQKVTPVVWGVIARFKPNAAPSVVSFSPTDGETNVKNADTISISFSYIMNTASTEAAFSISPAVQGTFIWTNSNQTLNFKVNGSFSKTTTYTVKLDTSAYNIYNKKLDKALSFSFTTGSRNKLSIVQTYPAVSQNNISTTAQFKVLFDAAVPYTNLVGKVELYNGSDVKQAVASVKISTQADGKGVLFFEPKNAMASNTIYYLLFNDKIVDANGIPLSEIVKVPFVTDAEKYVSGTVVDNFESISTLSVAKTNSGSTGIDTNSTNIAFAVDRKISGQGSGKINYVFNSANGRCLINDNNTADISNNFGIWIFGDLSMNTIDAVFNINGSNVSVLLDTLNWSGWKLKHVPASALAGTGKKMFAGLAINRTVNGAASGSVYFDDAQYDVVTSVKENTPDVAKMNYTLYQNYPNPFNPSTTIQYSVGSRGFVSIKVYDVLGREMAALVNEEQAAGTHSVEFNKPLASGIYYYTLRAGDYSMTRKMIILK